jgi:hypothetical protein
MARFRRAICLGWGVGGPREAGRDGFEGETGWRIFLDVIDLGTFVMARFMRANHGRSGP